MLLALTENRGQHLILLKKHFFMPLLFPVFSLNSKDKNHEYFDHVQVCHKGDFFYFETKDFQVQHFWLTDLNDIVDLVLIFFNEKIIDIEENVFSRLSWFH